MCVNGKMFAKLSKIYIDEAAAATCVVAFVLYAVLLILNFNETRRWSFPILLFSRLQTFLFHNLFQAFLGIKDAVYTHKIRQLI